MFEISWTDESEHHIGRHAVTPEEVEEATERPYYLVGGADESTLLYGRTYAGRYLLVVLAESADGRWYVATARDMTAAERRTFSKHAQ